MFLSSFAGFIIVSLSVLARAARMQMKRCTPEEGARSARLLLLVVFIGDGQADF